MGDLERNIAAITSRAASSSRNHRVHPILGGYSMLNFAWFVESPCYEMCGTAHTAETGLDRGKRGQMCEIGQYWFQSQRFRDCNGMTKNSKRVVYFEVDALLIFQLCQKKKKKKKKKEAV